ncbi:MAG: hypothetical protein KBF94_10730 [Ilumatobacteraceae bacterium]|nr:hypothetical protein [Ilumatobacteraceae bacterium]
MVTVPTINLARGRLNYIVFDDDSKVVTFWIPVEPNDPADDDWVFIGRDGAGELYEWSVDVDVENTEERPTSSGADVEKRAVTVTADTADFGEGNRTGGLFRNGRPFITGLVTVRGVPQPEVGS